MTSEPVEIRVGDVSIGGVLHRPTSSGPAPLVVRAPGWMSSAGAVHYRAYDTSLAEAGYAVLAVDYRGMGSSGHHPDPGRPFAMIEDLLAAVAFGSGLPEVDASRVGIFGTGGVGAGAAIAAASLDTRIRATAVMSAIADGRRWLREMRTAEQWADFLEQQRVERTAAVEGERERVEAIGDILIPPAVRAEIGFKSDVRDEVPRRVSRAVIDELLLFSPEVYAARLSPRALLVISCEHDPVVPDAHAQAIFERASAPKSRVVLTGTNSYQAHVSHRHLIVTELLGFYRQHLAPR